MAVRVSIPLNSGHRFNAILADIFDPYICLNPFEFRASIQLGWEPLGTVQRGLNPFEFRASIQFYIQAQQLHDMAGDPAADCSRMLEAWAGTIPNLVPALQALASKQVLP